MILRVKKCGAMTTVQGENGEVNKRTLVLQELGDKWANTYVVTVFRNLATTSSSIPVISIFQIKQPSSLQKMSSFVLACSSERMITMDRRTWM